MSAKADTGYNLFEDRKSQYRDWSKAGRLKFALAHGKSLKDRDMMGWKFCRNLPLVKGS